MPNQNLILNMVTFKHPFEVKQFGLFKNEFAGSQRIFKSLWPLELQESNPEYWDNVDFHFLYTDFETIDGADFVIDIDLIKNKRFAKRYYTKLISLHFAKIADVTNPTFVKDVELWFKKATQQDSRYTVYITYMLKVSIAHISKLPELYISYEGERKVLTKPILEVEADSTLFTGLIHKGKQYKYDETLDLDIKADTENLFLVLNNPLKYALNIEVPFRREPNKNKKYYEQIKYFFDTYINNDEFKKVIPVIDSDFYPVPELRIKETSKGSNLLSFGKKNGVESVNINPYVGILQNGPYSTSLLPHINMFFVYQRKDEQTAKMLYKYFINGIGTFPSLQNLLKTKINITKTDHVVFENEDTAFSEIQQILHTRDFPENHHFIAIYLTPITKDDKDPVKKEFYYRIKEELLKFNCTSQVVETETVNDSSFHYSLPNIAIAILAKLQGVPWILNRSLYNELIVGVGAFKPAKSKHRYIGSAFCFTNNGLFQGFECHPENDTDKLAGLIGKAVKKYANNHSTVKRLVIHFYKQMSKEEYLPIEETLKELELDIPIIIITINKTESSDIVMFDKNYSGYIPISGTFINIGYNQFLLSNNTRYTGTEEDKIDSFSFPVKLSMRCKDEKVLEDIKTVYNLVDQVYQFSRMYWKSVKQQNLPVTIKYPEMVAEIFPHFEGNTIPSFGKDNLWFL